MSNYLTEELKKALDDLENAKQNVRRISLEREWRIREKNAGKTPEQIDSPDPVDLLMLAYALEEHSQVPEREKVYSPYDGVPYTRPRRYTGCAAHEEDAKCCMDYFYDTIVNSINNK